MRTIAVINQKGGVGKSTSAFNIATAIAMQKVESKVAVLDLDPQASLTLLCGFEPDDFPVSIVDVMEQRASIKEIVYRSSVIDNLFLIPSHANLSATESKMIIQKNSYLYLRDILEDVESIFDYIDCPPQLSLLTISALVASTDYIVPTTAEYLSYKGLKQLKSTVKEVEALKKEKVNDLGVIVTMYSKRIKKEQEVCEVLREEYNVIGIVKRTTQTNVSIYEGKPVVYTLQKSEIAKSYKQIAEHILNR